MVNGCLTTFHDWPDPGGGSPGGRLSTGGTATGGTTVSGATAIASGGRGATSVTGNGGAALTPSSGGMPASTVTTGGSRATSGGATGGASVLVVRGEVEWLKLDNARANATDEPNGSLGIDGGVRVDSDPCVTKVFDPVTRCVKGNLCSYSYDSQFWGVALVFDFRSSSGTKSRWDPRLHNALGVAYSFHGAKIPKLQLWVLEMDQTTWPGTCSGSPCETVGPPYGDDNIGASGTLYFDAMVHDDWAGSGIDYTHQPEDTMSLQFKIPATMAGAAAFEICLDQLGIIVGSP